MARQAQHSGAPHDGPSRRTFVKGLAMGGVVVSLDRWGSAAMAQPAAAQSSAVVSGSAFDLRIGESLVN
jgi:hypothetical protein